MEDRLSKLVAYAAPMSRREADEAVRMGRVRVNGQVVTEPGYRVDPETNHIKVDGRLLPPPETSTYLVVNKPRGVSSSVRDIEGRPTVISMMPGRRGRLLPIMALERDDEGVVILTSDPKMAAALSRIDTGIERIYLLKVKGEPNERVLERMRSGVPLMGGRSRPMEVRRMSTTGRNTWLQVVTCEGRSHFLRHMMLKLNHPLVKLKRVSFGPVNVQGLPPGAWRELREDEVALLRDLAAHPPGLPAREGGARREEGGVGATKRRVRRKPKSPVRRLERNQVARARASKSASGGRSVRGKRRKSA